MSSAEVESILIHLKNEEDKTKLLQSLQNLNSSLQIGDFTPFEKDLHILLISFLENTDKEVQIIVLDILLTCIKRDLFHGLEYVDLAYLVVNIVKRCDTNNVDQQEVFIKAATCLQEMKYFHVILYKTRASDMLQIFKEILKSSVSSVYKIQVLKMLEIYIKNIDPNKKAIFLLFWIDNICPIMFQINENNLFNQAIEYSETLLPILQSAFQKDVQHLNHFISTIETTYLPIMANLVAKEQRIFSQLWIFLCKLLSIKFHQGFGMVNMMMTVVESAFKSTNIDIRYQAFHCWQNLIENFFINKDVIFNEKRVKLLTLPLRANNGKTEGIVEIKFNTWCKLLNVLYKRQIDFSNFAVLEQFLQFCFGPLCVQSLLSWTTYNNVSQGKKYQCIHLLSCKAFLQLFGLKKYISEELQSKLIYFEFNGPVVSLEKYNQPNLLIDSIGECCVMLSLLDQSDRKDLDLIFNALWNSLFDSIDNLKNDDLKQNCIQKLCTLILAMTGVARKRSALINYCLIPLFSIITSNNFTFFSNFKMIEILYIPLIQSVMKKDKVLLQKDVLTIFKMIFQYKKQHDNFLQFVHIVLEQFFLGIKDNLNQDKVDILQNIWFTLQDELTWFISYKYSKKDANLFCNTFCEFLLWPITTLNKSFSDEKLSLKWKEMYSIFGNSTNDNTKNGLAVLMLKKLDTIPKTNQILTHISKIIFHIISDFKVTVVISELSPELSELFSIIKQFVFMDDLSSDIVDMYVQTFQKLIYSSVLYPYFLEEAVKDSILCLACKHNRTTLLDDVTNIVKTYSNNTIYKEKIDKFIQILKDNNVDQNIINKMIPQEPKTPKDTTPKLKLRINKSLFSKHCSSDSEINKRVRKQKMLPNKEYPDITNNRTNKIVTLLGHNIETMTPVKFKDNILPRKISKTAETESKSPKTSNTEEIFVHTPYKFDPKKLTKSQKEKFSKRKDDIPALYQDLTQSTQELSNSNFETTKTEATNETKIEKIETNVETIEIKTDPQTKDDSTVSVTPNNSKKNRGRKQKEKENESNSIKKPRRKSVGYSEKNKKRSRQPRNTKSPNYSDLDLETTENLVNTNENPVKVVTRRRSSVTSKEKTKKIEDLNKTIPETIVKTNEIAKPTEYSIKPNDTFKRIEENLNLDLDEQQKYRVKRELDRIKMDIKNTDEFYKNEKRKTRTSFQNVSIDSIESDSSPENWKQEHPGKKRSPDPESSKKRRKAPKEDLETDPDVQSEDISIISLDSWKPEKPEKRRTSDLESSKKRKKGPKDDLETEPDVEHEEKSSTDSLEILKPEKPEKKRSIDPESSKKRKKPPNLETSPDVIEPTQEPPKTGKIMKQVKLPVLYPLDLVKPGEHIFINSGPTKTDIIKGPEPTSPFKVLETVKMPSKSTTCKEISFECQENMDDLENLDTSNSPKIIILSNEIITEAHKLDNTATLTLDTQILDDVESPEKPKNNFDCRKVLFESETPEIVDTTPQTPENNPLDLDKDLPGSPVSVETPTRNKELIKNTLEISPIKNPDQDKLNHSPELPSISLEVPERVGLNSPHPQKVFSRKKGRGAQMMDMLPVKPILSPKKKKIKENKTENFIVQHQERTTKIMQNLSGIPENGSSSSDEIKDEDILTFTRELPSPFASPGTSILKKRKLEEENSDSRVCKRRRVNFRDPLVSQKYIERNPKNRILKFENLPQESRITRSKVDQDVMEIDTCIIDLNDDKIDENTDRDDVKCTLFPESNDDSNGPENPEETTENSPDIQDLEVIIEVPDLPDNIPENEPHILPENVPEMAENAEKSNEVSVIKNSESLFSDSFSKETTQNIFEKRIPELSLKDIADNLFEIAAEKPELQNYLKEKLLSVVPFDEICKKFSWNVIMDIGIKRYENECKNNKN